MHDTFQKTYGTYLGLVLSHSCGEVDGKTKSKFAGIRGSPWDSQNTGTAGRHFKYRN